MTRAARIRRRMKQEEGQAAVEFLGWIGWVLLAAMLAWQLLLAGWTKIEATNAARLSSRVIAREGSDPKRAARNALPKALRKGVEVQVSGDKVSVRVPIPVIIPSASFDDVAIWGKAELPS